jgi:two-component system sensor kinase FixL
MVDEILSQDVVARKVRDSFPINSMPCSHIWLKIGQVMSKDVLTISPHETVAVAAMRMSAKDVSCILVGNRGNVAGILTETDLLKRTIAQGKDARRTTVAEVMSSPVQTASSELSVLDASRIMEDKQIKRLPILSEGKLTGIVTQTDLTRVLTYYGTWKDVSEIMSPDVVSIQRGESVADAAQLMASRNISALAVMAGSRVVGVLTERDLLKRVIALHKDPNHTKAEKVMSTPVVSVPRDFSIFTASKTMERIGIRRLLVIDDERLYGIVTQSDIFKAVKNKLQAEEQKNFKLLEESKSPIYIAALDHVVTYVNPAFAELFEICETGQFVGQPLLAESFWHNPADRTVFLEELEAGCFQSKELALQTATGRPIHVAIFSHFTTSARGEITGQQGIIYDMTAQKELTCLQVAEQALRDSEQKWRSLAENIADTLLAVDQDGRIRFMNHAVGELTPENVIGTCIYSYVKADHRPIIRDAIGRAFQTGRPQQYQVQGIGEHGLNTWWETRVVPVMDGHQVATVNLISTDITDRKEAEHRKAELLQQIERANRELKDFAYTVSHDLKTPLRGIKALATWLSDDYAEILDDRGKEQLALLVKRVDRMHGLIEGILQYSRAGHLDEQLVQIDLNELMLEIIDMLAASDHVAIAIDGELPVIEFEPTRIRQVFQNLLGNAVKYMDKPKGEIRIRCLDQADCWQFSVADNGPGIRKEHFERIFQMFQAIGAKGESESTGIGLALVKRIVETHGGTVWVESELGCGSTFFITVPKQNSRIRHAELESSTVS